MFVSVKLTINVWRLFMSNIQKASVIAFERKLCNSDGLMFFGLWENRNEDASWKPIKLQHKDVRCTISNRQQVGIASDPLKMNAKIQEPNLQGVDISALPFDADTLKLVFTLRIIGDVSTPSTCNSQEYQRAIVEKIGDYLEREKCRELSLRYAENIANGRFLWRNRIIAEKIEVKVSVLEGAVQKNCWIFEGGQFSLRKFSSSNNENITGLAEAIRFGLMGESYIFLKIETFARMGSGQEVFPSQELVRDNGTEKSKKSKVLYAVDGVAAMHSQKIGNAIRTIDTWYPGSEEFGPIAVEPFGAVTSRGAAYRQPKDKMDFYTLLDNWIIKDRLPSPEQQHFVVACLIRGGVFGEKVKER